MHLGIEIGGTKLQLAVGDGLHPQLAACERLLIQPERGAAGILDQIERVAPPLLRKFPVERIGIGFGGPVDSLAGRVLKSHQVAGWNDLPLADWCARTFERPTVLGNDCDVAALAESRFGAGRGAHTVFYVTVGTGVGGGLVIGGRVHGAGRPAAAEIGHLRPGPHATSPEETVESLASGWGLAAEAVARLTGAVSRSLEHVPRPPRFDRDTWRRHLADMAETDREFAADLLDRCDHDLERLTGKMVAQAAGDGNEIAREVLGRGVQTLGWAVAQVITLVAPEIVVVGGGVSLIGEALFFAPLRDRVAQYVFPPLADSYRILPAALGEEVVLHGALALAALAKDP